MGRKLNAPGPAPALRQRRRLWAQEQLAAAEGLQIGRPFLILGDARGDRTALVGFLQRFEFAKHAHGIAEVSKFATESS